MSDDRIPPHPYGSLSPDTETPAGTEGGSEDLRALRDRIADAQREHSIDFERNDPAQSADRCKCGQLIIDWDEHWADVAMAVVQPELDQRDADLASLQRMADMCREKDWAEIARLNAELAKLRRVGQIFMEKVAVTREAVARLDAAIPAAGDPSPIAAEIRDAFDALVSTLDLPKELP
jgi:hypothetical protein